MSPAATSMQGIALLRAVNVGGRVVKMERLRALFEEAGFTGVETFIASGNVIFDMTRSSKGSAIEKAIESLLVNALGYEVAAFVRTAAELTAAVEHEPFSPAALKKAARVNVAFLRRAPDKKAASALYALRSNVEDFDIRGREVYWLSMVLQSESRISNAVFEKVLKQPSTTRGINTVRKMAEKYGA